VRQISPAVANGCSGFIYFIGARAELIIMALAPMRCHSRPGKRLNS
jgi:hypothetical protein